MSFWSAVLLGLIQGVAEFLPISSSGHLSILQNLFSMNTAEEGHLFFDVLLHLGTLVSVCIYYRKDIAEIIHELAAMIKGVRAPAASGARPPAARRLLVMLIIALVPLFIVLPFKSRLELLYYNTFFVGAALILTGFLLFVSDKLAAGSKTEKNMTAGNALIIGLCQAIATIPGLSRSGTTITAGMACGLDRGFAVKFSFLVSLPAIFAANILTLVDAIKEGIDASLLPVYLVGVIVAGVSGYISIGLVSMLSKKGKFGKFSYYCWVVGAVTIILSIIF